MKTTMMLLGASLTFLLACTGEVAPAPQPDPAPAGEPAKPVLEIPVDNVVRFEVVTGFEGSQGILATECGQRGAGALLGGSCRVEGKGKLFMDQQYQDDGWTCVVNIDEGERVKLTLELFCLK